MTGSGEGGLLGGDRLLWEGGLLGGRAAGLAALGYFQGGLVWPTWFASYRITGGR